MRFYIKGLGSEIREKYSARLFCVEGAIEVLEEMAYNNIADKSEDSLGVLNNNDFSFLYDSVLRYICSEEEKNGFSENREKLDKVDSLLDCLTSKLREDTRKLEIERDKESIGPRVVPFDPKIYHLPLNISDARVG